MKNKRNILLFVLILIIVGVFVFICSGIKIPYFENYGANFRKNIKNIASTLSIKLPEGVEEFLNATPKPLTTEEKLEILSQMEEEQQQEASPTPSVMEEAVKNLEASSEIIALKNAYAGKYAVYKKNLLAAIDTNLMCFDDKGKVLWSRDIQVSDPILKIADNYIMVADKGANKLYLFSGETLKWDASTEEKIITADVSANGDVVVVTDKHNYKGSVTVMNRKGEAVFRWNSGKYEIIDADISKSSRKLAISLLNTDSGADSKISFFDLKKEESFETVSFEDSIAFDIEFIKDTLNVICDNKIVGISSKGKVIWTNDFGEKSFYRYFVEPTGHKLCVFDNKNVSEISILNSRGKIKNSFVIESFPDLAVVKDSRVLYNDGRTLCYSDFSGKTIKKYKCTRDLYNLLIVDSTHLVAVYNSSVEFIKL